MDVYSLTTGTRHIRQFFTKLQNDWVMSSAAGLAYNLMIAVVPIAIALISILGFILGTLDLAAQEQLSERLQKIFPPALSAHNILEPALVSLSKNAGLLGILAVMGAIFGGSRLFVAMDGYFDIIYRTCPRKFIAQNVMALLMVLVFIILTPLMIFASSAPALLLSLAQNSAMNQAAGIVQLVHNGWMLSVASILGSLLVSWILFEAIYMVVPNQKISLKKSWGGAIAAAVLLQIFLLLFPFYITHFMSSYTGTAGLAVIFLVFFYYFAVILLLGAEVNAYFAEGVPPLRDNIAAVLCKPGGEYTTHQAAPGLGEI